MKGVARPHPARPFKVRYQSGKGWSVQKQTNWLHAQEVSILAPVFALPDGMLHGQGVITRKGSIIIITA